jgi:hypothetical protein
MGNRTYYAIQQVGLVPNSIYDNYPPIHGIQSVSVNSSYNVFPVEEFARMSLYDTLQDYSEVQLTFKKVLDGYPLLYTSATADTIYPTLQYRLLTTSNAALAVFDENQVSFATGFPLSLMWCTGLSITSLRYNFNVNGNFEEEVSLVGNHKIWSNDTGSIPNYLIYWYVENHPVGFMNGGFDNTDSPIGSGGVNRRENMPFGESVDLTRLPKDLPSDAHVQNISISANISREPITQFGTSVPAGRIVTFPIEVTTEIGIISTSGEMVSVTPEGRLTYNPYAEDVCLNAHDISGQIIRVATCEGTRIYLGDNNKLTSINYTGGDAGGGNVALSYTYKGYNSFTVLHPTDTNTNFWEERAIWLSGHGNADDLTVDGVDDFSFGYNQGVEAPTGNLIDLSGLYMRLKSTNWSTNIENAQLTAFNFSADFNYTGVTGIALEVRPNILGGVTYNTTTYPFTSMWTGGLQYQIAPGKFLFNVLETGAANYLSTYSSGILFPYGMNTTSTGWTEYQYRVRGVWGGGFKTLPSEIGTITLDNPVAYAMYQNVDSLIASPFTNNWATNFVDGGPAALFDQPYYYLVPPLTTTYNTDNSLYDLNLTPMNIGTYDVSDGTWLTVYARTASMISPRHFYTATHISWQFAVGDKFLFMDKNNIQYSGTILGMSQASTPYPVTDVTIGILDTDMPVEIGFFKVMPTGFRYYLPAGGKFNSQNVSDITISGLVYKNSYIPCITPKYQRWAGIAAMSFDNLWSKVYHGRPINFNWTGWYTGIIYGDSSSPTLALLNNELLLIGTHWEADDVVSSGAMFNAVNQTMTALTASHGGGSYQLTEADFSNYTRY